MNIPNIRKKMVLNKQTLQALPLINTKSLALMLILGPVVSISSFAANIIDLGPNIRPQDVNASTTVVGARYTDQYPTVAFRWTISNGFENLDGTVANAVNDNEEIALNTLNGAFFFDGIMSQYIGDDYQVHGINSLGKIAGCQSKPNPFRISPRPTDPAIYDPTLIGQQWMTLDVANVYSRGRRRGIYADQYCLQDNNDEGYAVGNKSRSGLNSSSVFITTPAFDSVTFLPIPNGGYASAINNSRIIVGTTRANAYTGEYPNAFIFDYNKFVAGDVDFFTNLGTLPVNGPASEPGLTSYAYDINDLDQVVGSSWLETAPTSLVDPAKYHAFIWENGLMTDLNDYIDPNIGWVLTRATGINNDGLIVGYGLKDGVEHGFLFSLYAQPPFQPALPQQQPLSGSNPPVVEPTPTPSSTFPAIDSSAKTIEVEGYVTETGMNYFVVRNTTIWYDGSATIKFQSGTGNTIDAGEIVKVLAHTNVDGSGTAIEIKVAK